MPLPPDPDSEVVISNSKAGDKSVMLEKNCLILRQWKGRWTPENRNSSNTLRRPHKSYYMTRTVLKMLNLSLVACVSLHQNDICAVK